MFKRHRNLWDDQYCLQDKTSIVTVFQSPGKAETVFCLKKRHPILHKLHSNGMWWITFSVENHVKYWESQQDAKTKTYWNTVMLGGFAKNFSKKYCAEMVGTDLKDIGSVKKTASAQKLEDNRGTTIWMKLWSWVVDMVEDNGCEEGFITTLNARQLDRCTRSACLNFTLATLGICT